MYHRYHRPALLMLLSASLLAGCHKPVPRTKTMPITESTVLPSGGSNLALEQTLSAADHALFAAVYTPAAFTPEEGTLRPNATWDAAKLATLQRARADFAQPSPYFSLANVETALARGANPNAVCDGLTPLIHAASACHPAAPAIVNRLIAAGADVNAQPSFWASPLTNAVQLLAISQPVTDDHLVGTTPPIDPFPAIIKSLLRAGANPNMGNGMTPALISLIGQRHPQTPLLVGLLLAAGADPNNNIGEGSALLIAARSTSPYALEIVRLLVQAGAKLSTKELIKTKDKQEEYAFWRDPVAIAQALNSPNPAAAEIVRLLYFAVLDPCCAQDPEYFRQLARSELQREYVAASKWTMPVDWLNS